MTALILVSIVLLVLLRLLGPRPERDSCSRSLRVGDQVGAVIALALGFAFLISSMASAAPSGAALKFDSIRPSVARDQKSKSGVLLEGTLSQCTIRSNGATGFISSSLSFFRQYEYDGSVRSDARPVVTADYAVTLGVRGRALRSGHHRYDGPPLLRVSHAGMATNTAGGVPSAAEAADLVRGAKPVGSALKGDAAHRAASFVVDDIASKGTVFRTVGGDGVARTLVQAPGELNGVAGRFEWIVDRSGNLTHQMFVKGGSINGVPIKP